MGQEVAYVEGARTDTGEFTVDDLQHINVSAIREQVVGQEVAYVEGARTDTG